MSKERSQLDRLPLDALIDSYGRPVRKLRISVTDRCNFRCLYCMPDGDIPWLDQNLLLSFDEIARVARICVGLGIEQIRLTGGEPLARRDLELLVARLAKIEGLKQLGMTTNGYFLPEKAEALKQAGLKSVNISLDTLDPVRFEKMTKRNYYRAVKDGIAAALGVGFPVKINVVMMRGFNDDEIEAFIDWARTTNICVRFIEFMPLDGSDIWNADMVVPAAEIIERASAIAGVVPLNNDPSEPARLYGFEDGIGTFGIIPTISKPFCGACDRIRLTAEGTIRNCLFSLEEFDLRELIRDGADDESVSNRIRDAVRAKWAGHLINQADFQKPGKAMYAIGG